MVILMNQKTTIRIFKGDIMENTISLHEQRYNEMKARQAESLRAAIEMAKQDYVKSCEADNPASNNFDSKIGKSIYFKPLIYYNINESIANCKKLNKAQAASNIEKVREARSKRGQIIATSSELNKVKGQIHDSNKAAMSFNQNGVRFHTIVDEWCGAVCVFKIAECWYGHGKMKRRGYEMLSVNVTFWLKKGGGIGQEAILKRRFLYMPKMAEGVQNKKK